MCTVSFISSNNKFILTSNRDEQTSRPTAYEPKEEIINDCKIIYPKDPKAGGTWFAIKENGVAAVLLNGAFKKHIPTGDYRLSRGLLLLQIISDTTPVAQLSKINLRKIEPFTLILFNTSRLMEFRWDGDNRYFKELDTRNNYIWSSVTLYAKDAILQREAQFARFLKGNDMIHENSIIDFHRCNDGDFENGLVINRNDKVKTFSITQAVFEADEIELNHLDLLKNKKHSIAVPLAYMTNQFQ